MLNVGLRGRQSLQAALKQYVKASDRYKFWIFKYKIGTYVSMNLKIRLGNLSYITNLHASEAPNAE